MINLIRKSQDEIYENVFLYLNEIEERAKLKMSKAQSHPKNQHTVPNFLLKQIGAYEILNVANERNIMLKEHSLLFNKKSKNLGDFTTNPQLLSPRQYSTRIGIYSSDLFEDRELLEYLFSIVEGDAARYIRSKVVLPHEVNIHKAINPFAFSVPELRDKPSKIRIRVILSTFFAMQMLRSPSRKGILEQVSQGFDFATTILGWLAPVTIQQYYKQWTWIRVPNSEMFISELGSFGLNNCKNNGMGWILPLARRDFIYFHEFSGTHLEIEDKIINSQSGILYDWYINAFLREVSKHELKNKEDDIQEITFVSHRDAKLSRFDFYNSKGCCFGCVLDPIRNDIRNELFICNDIDIAKIKVNKKYIQSHGENKYVKY